MSCHLLSLSTTNYKKARICVLSGTSGGISLFRLNPFVPNINHG
jgi:hypothetical protein